MKKIILATYIVFIAICLVSCEGGEPKDPTYKEYEIENKSNHLITLTWTDTTQVKVNLNDYTSIAIGGVYVIRRDESYNIEPFGTADSKKISFDNAKSLTITKRDTSSRNILNPKNYHPVKLEDGSTIWVYYINDEFYNMAQ